MNTFNKKNIAQKEEIKTLKLGKNIIKGSQRTIN